MRRRMSRQRSLWLLQQLQVLPVALVAAERALHLAGNDGYRGEGRAKFVRGCGSQPVERREMLFALQRQFGCRQRIGQEVRLRGDAIGVEGSEDGGRDDAEPDPAVQKQRQWYVVPPYQGSGREKKASMETLKIATATSTRV